MNHCYYCEALVNRAPKDDLQHICEKCKAKFRECRERGLNPITGHPEPTTPSLRDFWTKPTPGEQDKTLKALPFEFGPPLTDEDKREMEGCGA